MKNFNLRSLSTHAVLSIIGTIGAIVFSQGLSFARWNDWQGTGHFINFHAILIAAGGLAVLFLVVVLQRMVAAIRQLEKN